MGFRVPSLIFDIIFDPYQPVGHSNPSLASFVGIPIDIISTSPYIRSEIGHQPRLLIWARPATITERSPSQAIRKAQHIPVPEFMGQSFRLIGIGFGFLYPRNSLYIVLDMEFYYYIVC